MGFYILFMDWKIPQSNECSMLSITNLEDVVNGNMKLCSNLLLLHRLTYTLVASDIAALRPRQDGRHFAGDIFTCNFSSTGIWISIKIALRFVLKRPIGNSSALIQVMAWPNRRQAINWTNDNPVFYAFMRHSDVLAVML